MFLLVSISMDAFERMMRMRLLYRQLGIEMSISRDTPALLRDVRRSLGGRLVLLDWSTGRAIADVPYVGAMGFAVRDDGAVIAASAFEQCVAVFEGREKTTVLSHRWFNYLHTLDLTPWGTYLLACAGSDAIVEMRPDGEVVWEWFGPEHGYATRPDGTPAFCDRVADYRQLHSSTAEQAMHICSAIAISRHTVLATLFHQGQLIAIDRASGAVTVQLDGLTRPHGIHRRPGGFVLSNTLGHHIILLDDDLKICRELPWGTQWLQDTIVTSACTYVTLENVHIDQLPEPGLSNRIVELDPSEVPLHTMVLPTDFRLFTVREVDEARAWTLAQAWGRSGDLDRWRWT